MSKKPMRVREPVQAYLDRTDADTLDELTERTSLSKAEVIRQAIRRMAHDLELASRPGAGLNALMGSLDGGIQAPPDLAARHDDYLYGTASEPPPNSR